MHSRGNGASGGGAAVHSGRCAQDVPWVERPHATWVPVSVIGGSVFAAAAANVQVPLSTGVSTFTVFWLTVRATQTVALGISTTVSVSPAVQSPEVYRST